MEILNSLGINFTTVIWHAVNFLILLAVLRRFLFGRVVRMLDERSARIRENLTHAEALRTETERLHQEGKQTIEQAWREAQQVLTDAQRSAETVLADARLAAREEANQLLQRARAEIEGERDRAFQELRQHVADLAVAAATQVVGRSLDDAGHRQLVEQFLAGDSNGAPPPQRTT